MLETLLAKSCKDCGNNKYLLQHTKMVINFGMFVGNKIFNEYKIDNYNKVKENFLRDLAIALATHDIGKCANEYQVLFNGTKQETLNNDGSEILSKKTINNPHNVYSWAYLIARFKDMSLDKYSPITSAVLYHHIVATNKKTHYDIISSLSKDELEVFDCFFNEMKEYIKTTFDIDINMSPDCEIDEIRPYNISEESLYGEINAKQINCNKILNDSKKSLLRACVILSDRFISSGKYDENEIINNNVEYIEHIFNSMRISNTIKDIDLEECGYDMERLKIQLSIVNYIISQNNHNVIGASAGFGKTLTGLLWFLKEKKKLIWVVPRNVIADGTYDSIIKELQKLKQTDVKVTLYRSGEIIKSNYNADEDSLEDADILVTNIDSILNRVIKNNMSKYLMNLYSSNIIFDEYHELFCNKPLFPTFIRMIWTRTLYTNSKTLLLSATPLKMDCFFEGETKNIIKYYNHNDIPIHNGDMNMNISYQEFENIEDLNVNDKDTFVITNTIKQSQTSFKSNNIEDSMLIHTWFTEKHREKIETNIYNNHDKNSNVNERTLVVGTNIIGVGLDISAKNIYDFVITPENTIQRGCGRGGRFNEKEYNNEINYNVCVIKDSKGNSKLIDEIFDSNLYSKWVEILKDLNGTTIKKKEMYDLYTKFYEDNKKEVNELYINLFNKGSEDLGEFKPHSTNNKNKKKTYDTISNALSYRGYGENVYVMARNENGEWSDSITINKNYIKDDEKYSNASEKRNIVRNYPTYNKYEFEKAYGLIDKEKNSFNVENLSRMAYRSDRPIPLINYLYDEKLGLYHIDNVETDED